MKTLLISLLSLSLLAGAGGGPTGEDKTLNAEFQNSLFTLMSAIGALDHCERELGYKITGKVDEVANNRVAHLLMDDMNQANGQMRVAIAGFADQVLAYADKEGLWIIGVVTTNAEGKTIIKGDRIPLDLSICGAVEKYIRQEMGPKGFIPKSAPEEPQA